MVSDYYRNQLNRAFKTLGYDLCQMSTVPEVIIAAHSGLKGSYYFMYYQLCWLVSRRAQPRRSSGGDRGASGDFKVAKAL